MAVPMWPGLSMFDIKDVPAATGYTFVTGGLVELIFQQRTGWRSAWGPIAILTTGLVLTIGSRPGLWPGLAASFLVVAVLPWPPPRPPTAGHLAGPGVISLYRRLAGGLGHRPCSGCATLLVLLAP